MKRNQWGRKNKLKLMKLKNFNNKSKDFKNK